MAPGMPADPARVAGLVVATGMPGAMLGPWSPSLVCVGDPQAMGFTAVASSLLELGLVPGRVRALARSGGWAPGRSASRWRPSPARLRAPELTRFEQIQFARTGLSMDPVNIDEARTRLSQLVDQAAAGEDVVVSRNGKPLVRITRLVEARPRVRFGLLAGKLVVPEDFDAPLPQAVLAAFKGR